jgi:hypothetical protein
MKTEILRPYYNYWDGPLEGLCRYEGKICYYSTFSLGGWETVADDDYDGWDQSCSTPRIYRVYSLSLIQLLLYRIYTWSLRNIIWKIKWKGRVVWYPYQLTDMFRWIMRRKLIGAFSDSECFVNWSNK